jgi:hypothetical protein
MSSTGMPASAWAMNDHEATCRDCRPVCWAGWYARTMGVSVDAEVTRIAWRYVPEFQHEAAAAMERAVG